MENLPTNLLIPTTHSSPLRPGRFVPNRCSCPARMAKTTMKNHSMQARLRSVSGKSCTPRMRAHRRTLNMERLESRQMMSATPLQNLSLSANAGEKPQSKIFEYAGPILDRHAE